MTLQSPLGSPGSQGGAYTTEPAPDEHYVVGDDWQGHSYDTSSDAPLGEWVKRPSGAASLEGGRLTGEDFPDHGLWKQA